MLLVADHASNAIPDGIDLGIDAPLMADHVAVDIGAGALAGALAAAIGCAAWLGAWSRLVCDVNREPEAASVIPECTDTIPIPGNRALADAARQARLSIHTGFHRGLEQMVRRCRPTIIVSIHSFTPQLRSDSAGVRPWPVGVLWNKDARAGRLAVAAFERLSGLGGPVGANQPYSGAVLNYTMNRHAETAGIPYFGLEIRQDLLASPDAIARWCHRVQLVLSDVRKQLL